MREEIIFGTSVMQNPTLLTANDPIQFPGTCYSDRMPFSVSEKLLSRHILLLGGSGCGKTNTFQTMMSQVLPVMSEDDIAIVFDTKGEFYDLFAKPGDYVIGNSGAFRQISHVWNIFDEILADGDDEYAITSNAREISAALFHGRGSSTQPFFCNAAKDIFMAMLLYFIRQARTNQQVWGDRLNNKDLRDAFAQFQGKDYANLFRKYPDFRHMETYIGDGSSNQALGVFGELNSMLSEFFVGILAERDPERSVSMRKAVRNKCGKTIFIEYDLSSGEILTPIYRLLVDQALKEALGRNASGKSQGRVFLFVDEFKLLPKLQHIDDALNFGRGLGVRVIAGIQSVDQLYDIYGKDRGNVLASGFGSLFAYHTNDASSRSFISERFGKNVTVFEYISAIDNRAQVEMRDGQTVEDWIQLQLGVGQAIISLGEHPPFLFQFKEYRR